jgi:predicted O-methyltransferase YrrM
MAVRIMNAELHPTTRNILDDMYGSTPLFGTESAEPIALDRTTMISAQQGAAIHDFIRSHSIKKSLEIGFAYGFSTIWILDALQSQTHVAIDPFQKSYWHGIGLAQVKRLGFEYNFRWIDDYSIHALSDMIRQKERFDFIYIDGNHRFDDVLVDFYLSDQVLTCGGYIAFDDMWMRSVRTVVSFIQNNRAYMPIPQPSKNMIILQKQNDDNRDWSHFNSFKVALEQRPTIYARAAARLRRLLVR